jgi:6-pyruvoyltetrahydropterin/6-carboxytetrahydropterin synthase
MPDEALEIVRREEFSASHRLWDPSRSQAENERLYGPCANRHGHNYAVEVAVRGALDGATGMVMNLSDLMRLVREKIIAAVDHRDLNDDVPFLRGAIPTAEVVTVAFWRQLEPEISRFQGCRLHRIRLYESQANFVDYFGPSRPRS